MIENNAKSLLKSEFVKNLTNQGSQKVLVIADIENHTNDNIDMELLSRKFVRTIRQSKKFTLTNAITGSGAKADDMIEKSRKLRDSEEFNQYTTIEKGNLLSPHLSLSGKIIQRTKSIGKNERVDYQFLVTLTDLQTGRVLWDNEEIISKVVEKEKVGEFGGAKSNQNSFYEEWVRRSQNYFATETKQKKEKSYSHIREKVKEFFSFGPNGRNHILAGIDFGLGGGAVGFAPFDYSVISTYIYESTTTHTMFYDGIPFIMPINIKLGYMRHIGEKWAFSISVIYNRAFIVPNDYDGYNSDGWSTTAASYEIDSVKLSSKIERFGAESLLYYEATQSAFDTWRFYIYGGGGALKDLNSKYTLIIMSGHNYSINKQGQRHLTLPEQKIDSLYPFVKFGGLFDFGYFGIDGNLYCSWATKEANYLGTNCGVSLGALAKF